MGHPAWNKGKRWNEETKAKMSASHKGQKGWNKGKTKIDFPQMARTEEVKHKISINNAKYWLGRKHPLSKETIIKMSESRKGKPSGMLGKHHSEEWKRKMSEAMKGKIPKNLWMLLGENHHLWKGGISKLQIYRHYKNGDYIKWRKSVFERDEYTCLNCGISGVYLHPHHIQSYTYYPELRYEADNGATLCVPCHHQLHFGK